MAENESLHFEKQETITVPMSHLRPKLSSKASVVVAEEDKKKQCRTIRPTCKENSV